ncbi:MAG: TonB-dependent receptor domain-containing protein [Brevundimonas sp.]|uniref:TonB-dependent receptor domain-containing protein n=1 Tax=Brevundimonas sp. TaxID=1871086 RepID=UPI00403391BB
MCCLAFAAPARATTERVQALHIPSQPIDEALLTLAFQARVSLGGEIGACRGTTAGLHGVMSLETALNRILAGSGCTYVVRPSGSIIIRRARPFWTAPARPPRPPATPRTAPNVEAPDADVAELSDVIVRAERRLESPQVAPAAVTSLSGEQIIENGLADANDLSSMVAGMTVTNLGSGRNKILLRGMSDGAFTGLTQSTVALYLNQAPLTYSAPDPDLKLVDLDRIEVLRGPQGTLYGTGPIGGVVRLVTRRPDRTAKDFDLSLTRSLTRGGAENSDYSLAANLPLLNGRAAVRGVIYEEAFGGYIDDVSMNLRRVNDGSRRGGRVAALVSLAPGWAVTTGYVHQKIDTEDTHYVYRVLGGLRRANLVREPHANAFDHGYVNLAGQGGWGRLDASISYVKHRFDSRYDASSALPAFGSAGRIGALDEGKDIGLLVGEATYLSPRASRLRWLVGAFVSTGTTDAETTLATLRPFQLQAYREVRRDDLDEVAVFGEAAYDLTPRLTAIVGGRLYGFRYRTVSEVEQSDIIRPFDETGRNTGLSPKLALAYRADDRFNLYAQITQGHRTGGFNTAGPVNQVFTGAVGQPAREYTPDTLWNYEVGAKARLWNGRVQARIATFMARWKDIQSDQFLPSGLAYAVNVGDAANKGIEIEANWQATDHLVIRANALLADPEITRPSPNFNSRGDAGLPGVPAASANLNIQWRRPLWRDIEVVASSNVAYVGSSRLTFDARRRYRMGDYVDGRISAALEAEHWSATAFIDNPFDSEANTFAFGDPFRLPEALATTPLRPRTVGLTLRWRP